MARIALLLLLLPCLLQAQFFPGEAGIKVAESLRPAFLRAVARGRGGHQLVEEERRGRQLLRPADSDRKVEEEDKEKEDEAEEEVLFPDYESALMGVGDPMVSVGDIEAQQFLHRIFHNN